MTEWGVCRTSLIVTFNDPSSVKCQRGDRVYTERPRRYTSSTGDFVPRNIQSRFLFLARGCRRFSPRILLSLFSPCPRQRMFDWRNSNSNSMLHNAHCITRKYDALASVRSRTDLSVGNLIRNINWHVLVSRITFQTRVTWMLDRCEGENREIQTRLEYVCCSWLTRCSNAGTKRSNIM